MCRDEVLLERQPEAGLIAQLYLAVDDSEGRVVEFRPDLIRLDMRAGGNHQPVGHGGSQRVPLSRGMVHVP